jgi:hypothetical protein
MNPPSPHASPDDASRETSATRLEAFITAFLRGAGRTPEYYDESWPATESPQPPRRDYVEGPERALG